MTEPAVKNLGPAPAGYLSQFRRCFTHRDAARNFDNYCRGLLSDLATANWLQAVLHECILNFRSRWPELRERPFGKVELSVN